MYKKRFWVHKVRRYSVLLSILDLIADETQAYQRVDNSTKFIVMTVIWPAAELLDIRVGPYP